MACRYAEATPKLTPFSASKPDAVRATRYFRERTPLSGAGRLQLPLENRCRSCLQVRKEEERLRQELLSLTSLFLSNINLLVGVAMRNE